MTAPSSQEHHADLPIMHGPSGIIALAGLIIGLLSIPLFFFTIDGSRRLIDAQHPPSLLAVNLSFCAMLMGIAAVYRVRRMPNQTLTRIGGILTLLLGLAGPPIFFSQAATLRQSQEQRELANLSAIIHACHLYAQDNQNHWPPNLATLLQQNLISPQNLRTPFRYEQSTLSPTDFANSAKVNEFSQYDYVGGDLTLSPTQAEKEPDLVVIFAKKAWSKTQLALGSANGQARMVTPLQAEAAFTAANTRRQYLGYSPLIPPLLTPSATSPSSQQSPSSASQ